jgi:hypothetical protein
MQRTVGKVVVRTAASTDRIALAPVELYQLQPPGYAKQGWQIMQCLATHIQALLVLLLLQVLAYAGVGVVPGSVAAAEWEELNLKVRQYAALLAPRPALAQLPNRNAAAAALLVEEACRAGVTTFCVAPGEYIQCRLEIREKQGANQCRCNKTDTCQLNHQNCFMWHTWLCGYLE